MPTVALRSCTLIGMQLVESMLGSVTKQIHKLHAASIRQQLQLCCVYIESNATRYAGGDHAAITRHLHANPAAAAAAVYQQGASCCLSKTAPRARQYIKNMSG